MQRHCGTTELGLFGNMTCGESAEESEKGPGPGRPIAMTGGGEQGVGIGSWACRHLQKLRLLGSQDHRLAFQSLKILDS